MLPIVSSPMHRLLLLLSALSGVVSSASFGMKSSGSSQILGKFEGLKDSEVGSFL